MAEAHTFEWRGQVYRLAHSADLITLEHKGHPARPYDIPIKGNFGTTSGELGITKVSVVNEVERVIMFPPRGGAYNPKHAPIEARPHYYERDATGKRHKAFKVFCAHCGDYQRRDAFSPDPTRPNGLRGYCKTCEAERARLYYHRQKAKRADKSLVQAA